ncbi:hypothetical protein SERLA73DRAFT_121827 [Serpula lacrymans var. lacrymans S7.3]|uniref:Reverse transcriptase Ty1/copia-type domain-containing protein n=1 Tax=Serpula lacrymans var. lacrymans (strain S7.3) TaxID=936435 RepID=F8PUT8_SERL3|nr:hypothetical protein SERLA73DRAFT_121827 [Serpula lacrymans var. lacrymans S7.3]
MHCPVDHAVFLYCKTDSTGRSVICIIGWHVNDGLGASNDVAFLHMVKARIAERFGIKDFGPVTKFIGIQFKRNRDAHCLWLHQVWPHKLQSHRYPHGPISPIWLPH